MRRHHAVTSWIIALGIVLLVCGVWLASRTMKRSHQTRPTKFPMPAARKMWTTSQFWVRRSAFSSTLGSFSTEVRRRTSADVS